MNIKKPLMGTQKVDFTYKAYLSAKPLESNSDHLSHDAFALPLNLNMMVIWDSCKNFGHSKTTFKGWQMPDFLCKFLNATRLSSN